MKRETLMIAIDSETAKAGWQWMELERFDPTVHVLHLFFDLPVTKHTDNHYTTGNSTEYLSHLEH
jgi:hypothetical protein